MDVHELQVLQLSRGAAVLAWTVVAILVVVVILVVVMVVVVDGPGPPAHWHKASTLQGHQD